jgi:hypothetical protein
VREAHPTVYIERAGIANDSKRPLSRAIVRGTGELTRTPLRQANAYIAYMMI